MSNSEDIDIDDDEPVWWDVLEEQYGRPLTEAELIKEIKASYEEEFLELTYEELQDDLKRQREWMAYKQEAAVRQEKDALTKSCAKTAADDLWAELCNPPIDEYGDLSNDGYERWVDNVNRVIKERIDFHSILEIMRKAEEIGISRQAAAKAVKRHSENHAIRDEIYAWLDANLGAWNSLNDAAAKMAMKVVPLKYECWRHLNSDPPCRSNIDPGRIAEFGISNCG